MLHTDTKENLQPLIGMNPIRLRGLLGHSSLEMTRRYVSMVDSDLLEAHKAFGPVDNLHLH